MSWKKIANWQPGPTRNWQNWPKPKFRFWKIGLANLPGRFNIALLPPEPHEDRDAIVEIRAGTGGNEAALFAADLYRMYCKYAEAHGFKIEELESSASELGGFKEIIFKVSGRPSFEYCDTKAVFIVCSAYR